MFFLIAVFIILSSCSKGSRDPHNGDFSNNKQEDPPYKISKDLETIKEDGVLHAITIYNSTSYFLYKGIPMGFEYELLSRLAKDLELELKITVAEDINDLFDMLNNGDGDLIAFGLTVTEPRKKLVSFTKYHYVTHQALVQKMPNNWRSLPGYKIDRQLISNTLELMNDTVWVRENSSYAERLENLQNEMGSEIPIEYIDGNITTDEIIKMVVDGEIERNIAEVLALNIKDLKEWGVKLKFPEKILQFLNQLEEIGLTHLRLDQPVQSLSSGEKQRLLLLNWLQEENKNTLYILDEPSTGLHYADIDLLYAILKKLSRDNDILVIDHNKYLLEKIGVGMVLT